MSKKHLPITKSVDILGHSYPSNEDKKLAFSLAMSEHKQRIDAGEVTTEHMHNLLRVILTVTAFGGGITWLTMEPVLENVFGPFQENQSSE